MDEVFQNILVLYNMVSILWKEEKISLSKLRLNTDNHILFVLVR